VPVLTLLALASRTPALWLQAHPPITDLPNEAPGSLLDQTFFFLMIAGSLLVVSLRRVKWSKLLVANAAITLFYAYFLVSSLWSAYPSASFIRVVKDFGMMVVVVLVILSEKNPVAAVGAVYTRCACVLFPLSVVLIRFFPQGRMYAHSGEATYVGAALQKNSLGEMVMVFILFLLWDHLETRPAGAKWPWSGMRWDFIMLALAGLWLLYVSESVTSWVCLWLGVVLILGADRFARPATGRVMLLIAMSLPFLLFFTQYFNSAATPLLAALGRDATFTGRTYIWEHITSGTVNPLIGAGFNNFWGGAGAKAINDALQSHVPTAHDGYLDIYLDGGVIGLVLLFCLLFASGNRLLRRLRVNRFQAFRFAFLIVAIVSNLSESNIARSCPVWFTTLLVLVEFPSPKVKGVSRDQPEEWSDGSRIVDVAS
jgi:O-antigen ligase